MSPTRDHTQTNTHSYTKTHLGRVPCFFVVTNNKYQKRNRVHFRDSLFGVLVEQIYEHLHMIKFVSLYIHTNADA